MLLFSSLLFIGCQQQDGPIKVGVLQSLTGTMAISERSVVDSTLMAIDEINAAGGLLGRQIEAVVIDGKSDWPSFAVGAEKLIVDEQVSVIFGCWTSASRKAVKPVIERYGNLLFYPVSYEGLEVSPNIIYTGSTPNQQLSPTVKWSIENKGKRIFLASSDYIFPRVANRMMTKQIQALGGSVVGEHYIPLGSTDVDEVIKAIAESDADVVLNTINGDSNIPFFNKLANQQLSIPVISFSITEDELLTLDIKNVVGHYSAGSYFQSLKSDENLKFVKQFKQKYGFERTTNASMEAAYIGVHLWSKSVIQANTTDPVMVRTTIKGQRFNSPEGMVTVSATNNHLWKPLYIGQIETDGQFKIIWSEENPIRPLPLPLYHSRRQWKQFLDNLYEGWGKSWAAPSTDQNTDHRHGSNPHAVTSKQDL